MARIFVRWTVAVKPHPEYGRRARSGSEGEGGASRRTSKGPGLPSRRSPGRGRAPRRTHGRAGASTSDAMADLGQADRRRLRCQRYLPTDLAASSWPCRASARGAARIRSSRAAPACPRRCPQPHPRPRPGPHNSPRLTRTFRGLPERRGSVPRGQRLREVLNARAVCRALARAGSCSSRGNDARRRDRCSLRGGPKKTKKDSAT